MARVRLRDLGLTIGSLPTGQFNAITDVAGVKVGYFTLIRDTPRVVRTGITAIWPRGPDIWTDYVFAGAFSFNGNGEMTGLPWVAEQGMLGAPIGITNTYQVGVVRDAICALAVRDRAPQEFHLPVVAETYDGWLSDTQSFPLETEHAFAASDSAIGGEPIAEGNVGGGTGMICHEFKGGTGTASRVVVEGGARYTVGALVQANYGPREFLRIDGCAGRSRDRTRRLCQPIILGARRGSTERRGRVDHRGARDRCTTHPPPVPAPRPSRDNRPCLGRRHREQRQRRHLHRLLDG